jgi:Rrf2 family nitric oxide-sensitive transcriptional repressor
VRFTKSLGDAVLLLSYVAQHPHRRIRIAEVARYHSLSASHLMNTAKRLAAFGYLATARGRGGGVSLGRPANSIRIGDLVRDLEPMPAADSLGEHFGCRSRNRRPMRKSIVAEGFDALIAALDAHTLAEISSEAGRPHRERA